MLKFNWSIGMIVQRVSRFISIVGYLVLSLVVLMQPIKIKAQGTSMMYSGATKIKESGENSYIYSSDYDSSNNLYFIQSLPVGQTDIDPTSATNSITVPALSRGYAVYKYDSSGSYIASVALMGTGANGLYLTKLFVDSTDEVRLGGSFGGVVDFDPGSSTHELTGIISNTTNGYVSISNVFDLTLDQDLNYSNVLTYEVPALSAANTLQYMDDDSLLIPFNSSHDNIDIDPTSGEQNYTDGSIENNYNSSTNTQTVDYDLYVAKVSKTGVLEFATVFNATPAVSSSGQFYYNNYNYHNLGLADRSILLSISGSQQIDLNPDSGTSLTQNTTDSKDYIVRLDADGGYIDSFGINSGDLTTLELLDDGNVLLGVINNGDSTIDTDLSLGSDVEEDIPGYIGIYDSYLDEIKINKTLAFNSISNVKQDSMGNIYGFAQRFGNQNSLVGYDQGIASIDLELNLLNYGILGSKQTDLIPPNPEYLSGAGSVVFVDNFMIDSSDNLHVIESISSYGGYFVGDLDTTAGENYVSDGIYLVDYSSQNYNVINNLSSGLSITKNVFLFDSNNAGDFKNGSSNKVYISSNDGTPLAAIDVSFSSDLDWSSVAGGVDSTNGKAYIHNLTSAPGASGTYSLYVPKIVDATSVTVCPGAQNLSSVNVNCTNAQILKQGDANLSTVSIVGKDYWVVSGLTGTGVVNGSSTPGPLANTGLGVKKDFIIAISILVAVYSLQYTRNRKFIRKTKV